MYDLEKYVVDVLRVRRPRTLSTSPTYGLICMNHSAPKMKNDNEGLVRVSVG